MSNHAKQIIAALIVLGVVGYFFRGCYNQRLEQQVRDAKDAERVAERVRQNEATRNAVTQLAARTGAVTDWEAVLSQAERVRLGTLLSIEVERVWVVGKPILFVGSVKDVSSAGPAAYRVIFEKSMLGTDYHFSTILRLSLTAPKGVIDDLLEKHPDVAGLLPDGVAVVARVNSVTGEEKGRGDERADYRIGHGELVDLLFIGSASLSKESAKSKE
jgi:hypothetical protein